MNFRQQPLRVTDRLSGAIFIYLIFFALLLEAVMPAATFTTNDAATIFKSYSNAFYTLSGTNAWFKADQTGGVADFWEQAEEIECVIDAYEHSANPNHKAMIAPLLDGFTKNNGTNWSSNIYNDDCMWACIAFARGYLVTGDLRFKDIARRNFEMAYARSWDTALGGGLYWTTANDTKNACVNGPGGIAAFLLYQIYGDKDLLAKATNVFAWERLVLFDPGTGAVSDGIRTNGTIHRWSSTYNQGTFIGLANYLGQTNDAVLAVNFTRDRMTDSGILPQYEVGGNNSGFNAIFFRWMTRFIKDRGLEGEYQKWLQDNADAAWSVRRPSDNLVWCQWQRSTPPGKNLRSWDCIATLEAMQLVPPTQIAVSASVMPGTNVMQNQQ